MSRATVCFLGLVVVLAGCGGGAAEPVDPNAPEISPPGDIPDNQAFVRYAPPGKPFSVKVPEGWARTSSRGGVTFTDKLNAITIDSRPAAAAPTVQAARRAAQRLQSAQVSTVDRQAGQAVLTSYLAPGRRNSVTGNAGTDA